MKSDELGPPSVPRKEILELIGDLLVGVKQWSRRPAFHKQIAEYYNKAESLIELLEIHDCGSFGGFDKNQPPTYNLFDRWDWLYRKYNTPIKEEFGCNTTTYDEIRDFFKK